MNASITTRLLLACAVLGVCACGASEGTYTGLATVRIGSTKDQSQTSGRLLQSAKSGVDMYLDGMKLPCGTLPLKKSGSSYTLKGSVDCETRTQSGSSTSTSSYSVTELEVSVTGKSLTINGKYSSRSGGGSSSEYQYDFDGTYAATN